MLSIIPIHALPVNWNVLSGDYNTSGNWIGTGSKPPDSLTAVTINNFGTASVSNAAFAGGLIIGDTLSGTVNITGAAANLSNSLEAVLGSQALSNGTVNVNGGTWNNTQYLVVGEAGTGTMTIQSLGTVTNTEAIIGDLAGSQGNVMVSNGTWNNSLFLAVGYEGTATLTIQNGGKVTSTKGVLGDGLNGSGTVTIDGVGSKWTASDHFSVGDDGVGSLTIKNDATMETNFTTAIGDDIAGNGSVLVTRGGKWISTYSLLDFTVGKKGTGSVTVDGGGTVISESLTIGEFSGSHGEVLIDGSGSFWLQHLSGNAIFIVGQSGTGILTLQNGGMLARDNGSGGFQNIGTISLALSAGSQGTLNIGNGAGAGTLMANVITGGAGTAKVVFNHNQLPLTVTSLIQGSTSVDHIGSGTTILTGNNTYTGGTEVTNGIVLANNAAGSATGIGSVIVELGAAIGGTGTIGVAGQNTTIFGKLQPGGAYGITSDTLSFGGNLFLGFDSVTYMQVGKLESDHFNVAEHFDIHGTLEVEWLGGDPLVYGDSFDLFDWGSQSGTFDNELLLSTLDPGLFWDISELYTMGIIRVVPEPSTWGLLVMGLGGLCFMARRRQNT